MIPGNQLHICSSSVLWPLCHFFEVGVLGEEYLDNGFPPILMIGNLEVGSGNPMSRHNKVMDKKKNRYSLEVRNYIFTCSVLFLKIVFVLSEIVSSSLLFRWETGLISVNCLLCTRCFLYSFSCYRCYIVGRYSHLYSPDTYWVVPVYARR